MKLIDFVTAKIPDQALRLRNLGKSFANSQSIEKSFDGPIAEAAKKPVTDVSQEMIDFAEDQLAKSSPHVHRKIRHFD